jgi:ketosteroid isomerase-like protein
MIALLVAALAAPPAYRAAVRALLRRNIRELNAGNTAPILSSYAEDVHFTFPGSSSWAADLRGRAALQEWIERFVRAGLQFEAREIVVDGPPWNTRVCVRFTDRCVAPDGRLVYENAGTIFGWIRWGKLAAYESHEDTERVTAFDEYLRAAV